jgi:uncharacterized membrane protein YdjX (TVP38/TMEM64 family)
MRKAVSTPIEALRHEKEAILASETTTMAENRDEMKARKKRNVVTRFAPLVIIVAGLAFAYAMGWHNYLSLRFLAVSRDMMREFVEANHLLAAAGFTVIYTLAVAFSFPAASVLSIFGGFLFGWLEAGILVAFAATAGASLLFLAARSAFGDFLRERVGGRVQRLADGLERDAFSYLLVLRLAPIFPFFVINIAPALFDVPLRTYVAATFLGILPGVFAYCYLGQGIDSVLVSAQEAGTEASVGDLVTSEITLAFVVLAVVAAVPVIIKQFRAAR